VVKSVEGNRDCGWRRIREELQKLPAVDSHDHLFPQQAQARMIGSLRSYLNGSLLATPLHGGAHGLVVPAPKKSETAEEGWEALKVRLGRTESTLVYRSLTRALRELYDLDIERITESNWRKVLAALQRGIEQPDWIVHVLRERGNVERVIWDCPFMMGEVSKAEAELFSPVFLVDSFCKVKHWPVPAWDSAERGTKACSLADVLDLLERAVAGCKNAGGSAIKCCLAYCRDLRFDRVEYGDAARAFMECTGTPSYRALRAFQDFIVWRGCELAARYDLPVQVHTGVLEGTSAMAGAEPMRLAGLIDAHPKTRFVLLHGGYPFQDSLLALAQRFDNVWVDGSWLCLLSAEAMRQSLESWLESLPSNKVVLWGGDSTKVEITYGALQVCKDILAEVLCDRIAAGVDTEESALVLARRLLFDNAAECFRLEDRKNRASRGGCPHCKKTVSAY